MQEVELHVDSHVKIKNSLAAHQQKLSYSFDSQVQKIKNSLAGHQQELSYTLILIYQHLKQPAKTSAGVELQIYQH